MSASLARQARQHNLDVRSRISALPLISPDDDRLKAARQLTHNYTLRQIDQCEALLGVIGDMRGKPVLLVHRSGKVAVWTHKAPVPALVVPMTPFGDGLALFDLLRAA